MHDITHGCVDPANLVWRARRSAFAGLLALAVAMGVGRFAFTPILPMMQVDAGLSLRAAGWLAAANYLGYLLGALGAARLSPVWAIRGGLLLIALVTFGMGSGSNFVGWLVLRLLAGIASAWVLVHVSAWALERLLTWGRPALGGVVFAGVGVGIAGAGALCMVLMRTDVDSARTWQVLGVLSLLLLAALWTSFRVDAPRARGGGSGGSSHGVDCRQAAPGALLWRVRFRLHHPGNIPAGVGAALDCRSGIVRLGVAGIWYRGGAVDVCRGTLVARGG